MEQTFFPVTRSALLISGINVRPISSIDQTQYFLSVCLLVIFPITTVGKQAQLSITLASTLLITEWYITVNTSAIAISKNNTGDQLRICNTEC